MNHILAQELSELLAGASVDLQFRLGLIADHAREATQGDETPAMSAMIEVLRSYGRRADRVLTERDREAARAFGRRQYERQQRQVVIL